MTSILDDFANAVCQYPNRIAIIDGKGRKVSFAQLYHRADGLARAWFAKGIRHGDRVLLATALDADLYASLAALWSLGATVVLPEPAMGIAGLRHAARVSDASAFCSSGYYGLLKYALPELRRMKHLRPNTIGGPQIKRPEIAKTDTALISFTSGTSGDPKAIPRSHAFLSAQRTAITPLLESDEDERDLVTFPVFVLINIASGRTSVLPNWEMSKLAKLDTATLGNWIAKQNVTRALLPPSLCEKLLDAKLQDTLHTVFTGGGPVFPDVLDQFKKTHPKVNVICVYGSTEAEPIAHLAAQDITETDGAAMLSGKGLLVGHPVDDIAVRIFDDEIQVAGRHVNGGYLNPAHDLENKVHDGKKIWHRTGDAGYFDDTNRLWLLGRTGSQTKIGGTLQYPFSIEVAARQWVGVSKCAVVEINDAACLFIEGNAQYLSNWTDQAKAIDITCIKHIDHIPMDKRHASKVDRKALKQMFE